MLRAGGRLCKTGGGGGNGCNRWAFSLGAADGPLLPASSGRTGSRGGINREGAGKSPTASSGGAARDGGGRVEDGLRPWDPPISVRLFSAAGGALT